MGGPTNPRRATHADTDIALCMEMGLGRMQADTHPNHTRSKKGTLGRNGRRDGVAGTLKANK